MNSLEILVNNICNLMDSINLRLDTISKERELESIKLNESFDLLFKQTQENLDSIERMRR